MLIVSCILEMIKYILAEYLFLGRREKNHRVYIVAIAIYAAFAYMTELPAEIKHLAIYLIVVFSFGISVHESIRKKLLYTAYIFLIMTGVSGIIQFLHDLIVREEQLLQDYWIKDVIGVVLLSLGILIKLLWGERIRDLSRKLADVNIMAGTMIAALFVSFTISLVGYSQRIIGNGSYSRLALGTSGIAYISIVFMVGMAVCIEMLNAEMKEHVRREGDMRRMQEHEYAELLKKDAETRAFRHDISNHLICMSALVEKGEMEALADYIDDMKGEIQRIKGKRYDTGNEILDIITNYYLPQLSSNIKVRVEVADELITTESRICTIYANVLQNAVEELNSDRDRAGELNIILKQIDDRYMIMVENSIFREYESNHLITRKKDKINHGIGLKNVQHVVDEMGGRLIDCW